MALSTADIQGAYVTFFNRPADAAGLNYWGSTFTGTVQQLYTTFAASTEYTSMYAGMSNLQVVNTVYNNLFGHNADLPGLLYWTANLDAGRLNIAQIANSIKLGAQGSDAVAVSSKVSAATAFTAALDTLDEVLGYDGTAANTAARTWLSTVTDAATLATATATSALNASVASVVSAGSATSTAGSTFTLTTSVDAVSGTAGNDTINGVIGNSSGTYSFGDDIRGGSGTDTLNILDGDGTAVGVVSLDSVENVNVRVLVSGVGNITELNAADWSGVATLTNASSTDDSQLQVSGLTIATDVTLYGETTIGVNFANLTSGTDTATVSLIGAGSARSASTYASANTEGGLATIDVDLDDGGLVDGVNIQASGTNYVTLEGGADLRTINVSGSGALYMATDDLVTGFNAAGFNGAVEVTFNGASEVNAVGGAGNDTFIFGTTLSNSDSVSGGSGTDTIAGTLGAFNRTLQTTGVEVATITFTDDAGGQLNASGSTVSTFNLRAGSAGADAIVNNIANGSTVNLTVDADGFDDVSVDAQSGASTLTIVAGTASGNTTFDLDVTDVANVTLSNVAGTATNAGTLTIATATFDSDTKSIAINAVTGTGAISFTDLLVGGATAVTITSNASGGITLGTGISGSALRVVNLTANGSADIVGETIEGSGLASITLDANGGGNIYLRDTASGIELGNNGTGSTQSVVVLNLNAETNSDVGTAASGASGVAVNTTGSIGLSVNFGVGSASGGVHLGVLTVGLGGASADTSGSYVTLSAGSIATNSVVRSETINIDGMSGTQVNIGAASVGASATYVLASGGIDATNVENVDVSAGTLTLAASAIVEVGAITTTAGAVNGINVVASDGASATFGAIIASAVGAITVSVASGASANFGNILASGSAAGSIVGAVGSIELSGSDGAGVTFGTIGASALGAVAVSGALDVTFGTITTNRVGTIDARNQTVSGAMTIDLSGVSAAAEVYAGLGANVIISGKGNDVIDLIGGRTAATGNDVIRYTNSAQGTDNIIDFIAGGANSGGDQIEIVGSAGIVVIGGSGEVSTADRAVDLYTASAGLAGAIELEATDNIVVMHSAYANATTLIAAIASGGAHEIGFAGAGSGGFAANGNLVVVWFDGSDTQVSLVSLAAGASAVATASTVTTLATLQGVTPGALVAANFDFI